MDWPTFLATLVGAGVSIATSLIVFSYTSWVDGKRARERAMKDAAFLAFRGLQKLIGIANDLANTERHINEAFRDAADHGLEGVDPFEKVKPIIGARIALKPLNADEMFFLVDLKKSHVMGEIELIYHRAINVRATLEQFNRMRLDFEHFLESRTKGVAAVDGMRGAFDLQEKDAKIADFRGGAMNNLLGQLMERLEEDCVESKRLAEIFLESAQSHFGAVFPSVKLEWAN